MAFWQKQGSSMDGWAALTLGSDRIVLAEIMRQRDARPKVLTCEHFAREGGELESIKRLKAAKKLGARSCSVLLDHAQYQLIQVDRPDNLAQDAVIEEKRDTLRWRIKEMVDFPVDQAGIDVIEIPAQGPRAPQFWVTAASHDILRPRVHLFQDAKLPLAAIDIPEMAQRNLATLFEEAQRGLALVAFDANGGRLTITFGGELYMTRHLDVTAAELANPNAGAIHERVLLDIQRSLDNFDRNFSSITVNRLLVGPMANGYDFLEYLRGSLSLPVIVADLADVLDIDATPQLKEPAAQADAWLVLGAALRE